jgi:predicted TIM-barrel fold metal-dependent hydrolase
MSGYTIIDVDTHLTESPDAWTSRVPASMRDRVPRVEQDPRGRDIWMIDGQRSSFAGMTATAGRGDFREFPPTYADMHPAAYDAKERLAYMDEVGIWAMVLYPNVGGFGSQQFLRLGDPELMLACVQAYNDFQTEWASADPRRLLPITSTPFWDIAAAVDEVRRCAALGHRGILFTGEPHKFGQPLLGDRAWDPLWETAVELGLPISFHIGSGNMEGGITKAMLEAYGKMAAFTASSVEIFLKNAVQLTDLLISGVLARFPEIEFVSVESGIGWIPFVLEALDYQFLGNRVAEERPDLDMLPSEYFARNVYGCYWFEQVAPRRLIDKVGEDRILFETDFPHPTSLFGAEVHERIEAGLSDSTPEQRRAILWGNAQRLYKVVDPTPEDVERQAKVAALPG